MITYDHIWHLPILITRLRPQGRERVPSLQEL